MLALEHIESLQRKSLEDKTIFEIIFFIPKD